MNCHRPNWNSHLPPNNSSTSPEAARRHNPPLPCSGRNRIGCCFPAAEFLRKERRLLTRVCLQCNAFGGSHGGFWATDVYKPLWRGACRCYLRQPVPCAALFFRHTLANALVESKSRFEEPPRVNRITPTSGPQTCTWGSYDRACRCCLHDRPAVALQGRDVEFRGRKRQRPTMHDERPN